MTRLAAFTLGLGIGALLTTPLASVIAAVICGEDWREVLHGEM